MDIIAMWIGYAVLMSAGLVLTAIVVYASVYWITYAINNSHRRAAETIAGKDWLKLLRKAAEERDSRL